MAIKYYLTVSSGNYTIETTEGCGFSGSCANLACAFDDSQESVRITDKAWRNWMPILDATADEIETDGDDLSYSELIAYLQTIMTSGGGGGGGGDYGLQLGETSTTAYRGDRGKTAYNHAQLTTGNPHNVSKSDVGLGNVDNTSDLNKPVSSAMQTALSGKANSTHSHAQSDVNGLAAALSGKQDTLTAGSNITIVNNVISATGGGGGGGANWGEIGGTLSNQTDLATALNGKASSSHSHSISDVTNLQSSLDGKASSTHSHTISDVTDLQSTLNGKASSSHSHSISDVTNLQSSLDGKASSTHSHTISEITNLQSTLNGKFEETESGGSGIAPYLCEIKATISGGSLSFASDQVENLRKMFASMYSENKARHICVLTITGGSTTPLTLCTVDLRSYSSTGGSAKFVNTTDYTEILITYANNAVTSSIDKLFWVGTTTQYNALSSGVKNSGKPFFTTD